MQVGSLSPQTIFYSPDSEGSIVVEGQGGSSVPGCVTGTGSFTCTHAAIQTSMLPVTFSTPTAINFGLFVGADPFGDGTSIDPGLSLTGITLYNAEAQQISSFSITSGSGAVYGADGIISQPASASVPEPSSVMLLAFMLLGMAAMAGIRIARGLYVRAPIQARIFTA